MRRYWVEKEALQGPPEAGSEIVLRGDVLHHIRDVCRQHMGSKFEVIIEGGIALLVEITHEAKNESRARVVEKRAIPELPRPHVHLALSIPRFPVFEAVVEKAVELGVASIQPFFSDFSFIRKQEDTWVKKLPRFQKIVVSATQQSGRGDLMPIREPAGVDELARSFNRTGLSAGLFAYEGSGETSDGAGVREIVRELVPRKPQDVWLFVGGEGGFSDREVEVFRGVGLRPASLGRQVLRVETACVALVSVIKYDFDLMR